jgi:hypothetical protein
LIFFSFANLTTSLLSKEEILVNSIIFIFDFFELESFDEDPLELEESFFLLIGLSCESCLSLVDVVNLIPLSFELMLFFKKIRKYMGFQKTKIKLFYLEKKKWSNKV